MGKKSLNLESYSHIFSNILKEKWNFDDSNHSEQLKFEADKIEELIYENTINNKKYILGKLPKFYFLAIFHQEEENYGYTMIYKHDTVAPLVSKITEFKLLHPGLSIKNFVKSVLFENKLEELLEEKSLLPIKVKKI